MSYATTYLFPESGPCVEYRKWKNSWRGAYLIWDTLSQRYFGAPFSDFMRDAGPFWKLSDDPKLESWERDVLLMTYDRAIVPRSGFRRMKDSLVSFGSSMKDPGHILDWATYFSRLDKGFSPDAFPLPMSISSIDDIAGAGFHHTSVSDNLWRIRNEEDDDSRPYDLAIDTGHWFLFDDASPTASSPSHR